MGLFDALTISAREACQQEFTDAVDERLQDATRPRQTAPAEG